MSEPAAPPRPPRVSVVGASVANEEEEALAHALGVALAKAGALVVCGGRSGVMEAVARGAAEAGGTSVGILPGPDASDANPWITTPIATGLGEARNALVVRAGEAVVSIGGRWGTLSEIALARKMGRTVFTLGRAPALGLDLTAALDPDDAARRAVEAAVVYRRSPGR